MTIQNTINPLEILARLSWGESDDLEFKSAKGGIPTAIPESDFSLANKKKCS